MRTYKLLLCFLLSFPLVLLAQSAGLGKLDFPNNGLPAAQEPFLRGMLLLHSFEFEDAAEAFAEAQKIDPNFSLAYWGEAMTHNHPLWYIQDKEMALRILDKFAPTSQSRLSKVQSPLEKDLFQAIHVLYGNQVKEKNDIAYRDFMAALYDKYPQNTEIACLYALSIMGASQNGRDMMAYKTAGEIIEKVYAINPDHPGALHYLIHAYDDPYNAHKALDAAFRYAKVAPDAAHALHMPTHIFVAKGMWQEVVKSNIDSWEAAESRRLRKALNLQARGYHSFHWLQYGLLQLGNTKQAKVLLDSMVRDTKQFPSKRLRNHLSMMQACYIVESEDWQSEAVDINVDYTLLTTADRAANMFAKAYATLKRGEIAEAKVMYEQMVAARINEAPVILDKDMTLCHAVGGELYDQLSLDSKTAAVIEAELAAVLLYNEGKVDSAFKLMDRATEAEMQLPLVYGPPEIIKPSHELYGELLLTEGQPEKASAMFEMALLRAPNRRLSVKGLQESKSKL